MHTHPDTVVQSTLPPSHRPPGQVVTTAWHVPLVHVWPDAQQALPHGEPESHVNPHTPSVQVAWPLVTAGQSAAVQHAVFAIQVAVAPVPQALKPLAHSKPHWPPLQTAT
jgi:hypothetical protein